MTKNLSLLLFLTISLGQDILITNGGSEFKGEVLEEGYFQILFQAEGMPNAQNVTVETIKSLTLKNGTLLIEDGRVVRTIEKTHSDSFGFINKVDESFLDSLNFFDNIYLSIFYSKFKKEKAEDDYGIYIDVIESYTNGIQLLKPYKILNIQFGFGSTTHKSNSRIYWTQYRTRLHLKYISLGVIKEYSPSFLNFTVKKTKRFVPFFVGFNGIIYIENVLKRGVYEQFLNKFNQVEYVQTVGFEDYKPRYISHQIQGVFGFAIPLSDLIDIKISGRISNPISLNDIIIPEMIDTTNNMSHYDIYDKKILYESRIDKSLQIEFVYNLFKVKPKKLRIIKPKKSRISEEFEGF